MEDASLASLHWLARLRLYTFNSIFLLIQPTIKFNNKKVSLDLPAMQAIIDSVASLIRAYQVGSRLYSISISIITQAWWTPQIKFR